MRRSVRRIPRSSLPMIRLEDSSIPYIFMQPALLLLPLPLASRARPVTHFAVRHQNALDGASCRTLRDPGIGESAADALQLVRRELDVLRTQHLAEKPAEPPMSCYLTGRRCSCVVPQVDRASPSVDLAGVVCKAVLPTFGERTYLCGCIEPTRFPDLRRRHGLRQRQSCDQMLQPGDELSRLGLACQISNQCVEARRRPARG